MEQALGVDMLWTVKVCGDTAKVQVSYGHKHGAVKGHRR